MTRPVCTPSIFRIAGAALTLWSSGTQAAKDHYSAQAADARLLADCQRIKEIQASIWDVDHSQSPDGRLECDKDQFIVNGARQIEVIGLKDPRLLFSPGQPVDPRLRDCYVNIRKRENGISTIHNILASIGRSCPGV
jgi:hypothetical protein